MSRRLLDAGSGVAVWNSSAAKGKALVDAGAKAAANPSEVAASSSIIFLCLTDAGAVEDVVFGAGYIASVPGTGKLVVDFSSIARAIAVRLKDCRRDGLDRRTPRLPTIPRRRVPMATLAAQLFRLANAARGADVDALEIYKISASQWG